MVKGVYLYRFLLERDHTLRIGRLGVFGFGPGCYIYAGSALGGLNARLDRHRRFGPVDSPHWHIDWLSALAVGKCFAVVETAARLECELARSVAGLPGATSAAPRFGASDCRCATHLFRLERPQWPRFPGLHPWPEPELPEKESGLYR
ncbi:GIY-YIG nuclease family protein [bacterium]|nr:GIY-YIG nuclease family protein [bacterium]